MQEAGFSGPTPALSIHSRILYAAFKLHLGLSLINSYKGLRELRTFTATYCTVSSKSLISACARGELSVGCLS